MKIRKYAIGGLSYEPIFRPELNSQQTPETTKSEGFDLDMIKDSGLINDYNYVADLANLVYRQGVDPLTGSPSMIHLLELSKAVNAMKNNYKEYEKAVTHIESEGNGHDVAITQTGLMYVMDMNTSEIKTISVDDYFNNSNQYKPLTNADMLEVRNISSSKTMDSSILKDLYGSRSMKSVTDHLLDVITKFGVYSEKMKDEGYSSAEIEGITNGINLIKESSNVGTSYEGYDFRASEESLFHINQAANYLWSQLDKNMKQTFLAHAAAEGYDPSDINTIYSLLGTMIAQHTNHTYTTGYGVSGAKNGRSGSGNGSGSGGNYTLNLSSEYTQNLSKPRKFLFSGQDSNQLLYLPGYNVPILKNENTPTDNKKELASTRLQINNNLGLINDSLPIYFGSNQITKEQLTDIGLDLTKGSEIVYLPQTKAGEINWKLIDYVNKLTKEVQKKDLSKDQLDSVWVYLLDKPDANIQGVRYNTNTHKIEFENTKPYIVYYGITSSSNDNIGSNTAKEWLKSPFIVEPSDDYAESFDKDWNNTKGLEERDFESDLGYDTIVAGQIFMPVTDDSTTIDILSGKLTGQKMNGAVYGAYNQYVSGGTSYDPITGLVNVPNNVGQNFNDLN